MEKTVIYQGSEDDLKESIKETIREEIKQLIPKQEEKLISREEARHLFQPPVSKPTIIKWEKEGKINSYRIGGKVLYKRSEIMESITKVIRYSR